MVRAGIVCVIPLLLGLAAPPLGALPSEAREDLDRLAERLWAEGVSLEEFSRRLQERHETLAARYPAPPADRPEGNGGDAPPRPEAQKPEETEPPVIPPSPYEGLDRNRLRTLLGNIPRQWDPGTGRIVIELDPNNPRVREHWWVFHPGTYPEFHVDERRGFRTRIQFAPDHGRPVDRQLWFVPPDFLDSDRWGIELQNVSIEGDADIHAGVAAWDGGNNGVGLGERTGDEEPGSYLRFPIVWEPDRVWRGEIPRRGARYFIECVDGIVHPGVAPRPNEDLPTVEIGRRRFQPALFLAVRGRGWQRSEVSFGSVTMRGVVNPTWWKAIRTIEESRELPRGRAVPGLRATYYEGIVPGEGRVLHETAVRRIQYRWGEGTPIANVVPHNRFSIRFEGYLVAPKTGTYRFWTESDDGIRLTVGDTKILEDWTDHAPKEDEGTIDLTEGIHPIRLEWYENGGGATVRLAWIPPGAERIEPIPDFLLWHY